MSTRHDKNFKSYENRINETIRVGTLNPAINGWEPGSWQDTMKTFQCHGCDFTDADIRAGTEDALDVGTRCYGNKFRNFMVVGGKYVITLKSDSDGNIFENWTILKHGKSCDIQLGNWSSTSTESNENNVFRGWKTTDGSPITYSYRFGGGKPIFYDMKVKHLWWLSVGITAYWWAKYFWHKVLKRPDK